MDGAIGFGGEVWFDVDPRPSLTGSLRSGPALPSAVEFP